MRPSVPQAIFAPQKDRIDSKIDRKCFQNAQILLCFGKSAPQMHQKATFWSFAPGGRPARKHDPRLGHRTLVHDRQLILTLSHPISMVIIAAVSPRVRLTNVFCMTVYLFYRKFSKKMSMDFFHFFLKKGMTPGSCF